ncbi:UNVERIFIED_CONTAM: hypothetical protein O8I53_08555 [Campylobacter lari]
MLGKTAKFPKHSIAFKYDVEIAQSKIINIFATVGRTGKITYVAQLEPVELNQTIVKAATLHNYNFIKSLNIDINDEVKIIKAGEIIPKVIGTVINKTSTNYSKVLNCPSCDLILVEYEEMADQFCLNKNCPDKNINIIDHFCSRKCLNIVGLGTSTVKDFYPKFIKNINDIFSLKEKRAELLKLKRYGELKVNKLLNNIENAKNSKFEKVLFALGIKHLGQRAAKLISNEYSCFKDILEDRELFKLKNIKNIGPKIIDSIFEFINDEDNIELMNFLDNNFTYENENQISSTKLANLTFVITGKLTNSRDYYVELIEQNGGHVSSSISSKTNYLLMGEDAGSKKDKAEKLKIKIITEQDFLAMIE